MNEPTIHVRAPQGDGYFFWLAVLLLVLVLVGFSSVMLLQPATDIRAIPLHLHIHGGVLLSWFVWLVLQVSLVRSARRDTHRRLGWVGAGIGATCLIAAPLATVGAVSTIRNAGLDWDTDMSAYPKLGIENMSFQQFAEFLVFGNLASVIAFGALVALAVRCRRNAETHKRLMILASLSIIGPALARISRWPGLGGEDSAFIPLALLALLLSLFVHDYLEDQRIHRATWMGTLFIVLVNVAAISISHTSAGRDFVHYLGGL
jgi:hypothetical protein